MISGVSVAIALFFGLSYIKSQQILEFCKIGEVNPLVLDQQ
jgi:hypothetical protein